MPFEDVPDVVRSRMSRIRKVGTKPEVLVRRAAHRLGYRFRINRRDLPGTPDIVFPMYKKIISVHGCFWHQHPGCRHANMPQVRQHYWAPKLARTVARDQENVSALSGMGWRVLVLWECELVDGEELEKTIKMFLRE